MFPQYPFLDVSLPGVLVGFLLEGHGSNLWVTSIREKRLLIRANPDNFHNTNSFQNISRFEKTRYGKAPCQWVCLLFLAAQQK